MEGSPQENWGMFSYPFYLRMKESTPEFAGLAAFQAGATVLAAAKVTASPSRCAANLSPAIIFPPSALGLLPDAPSLLPTTSLHLRLSSG